MSVTAPLTMRQRVIAAKVETTTGTAETLANADAAMNLFNAAMTVDIPVEERPGQLAAGTITGVAGARSGRLTFESEFYGSGTPATNPLWSTTLLMACGFSVSSQVFSPSTPSASSYTTLTMGFYEAGRARKMTGAVGGVTMTFTVGKPVKMAWEFLGALVTPADDTILAPTLPTIVPPAVLGATFTVGGTAYAINEMVITIDNSLTLRQDATQATGYISAVAANKRVTVTMDPEAKLFATKNWYSDLIANTEAALSIAVGGTADNILTVACPKLQLTGVQGGDRDGVLVDSLTFTANRSSSAGNDEITLTLS